MSPRRLGCALVLAAVARAAPATGLPTNVCHDHTCGDSQSWVWTRFQAATGLGDDALPGIYSGRCWHKAKALDRDHTHHAGVLLDLRDGRPTFDGRFAFFREGRPYRHLDLERARARFTADLALEIHDTYAVAEDLGDIAPYRYWLREEAGGGRLLLVGYFGFDHTVLCELERNPR